MRHLLAMFLCAAFIVGCHDGAAKRPPAAGVSFDYEMYRDLPGVTADEIAAVESLRESGASFVYGMNLTTETFRRIGAEGEIGGFTALFCEYLTNFLGIPFKPALYEWDELMAGLESGDIDFTGELTATDERRKTYFMTAPIAMRTVNYFRAADSPPLTEIAAARIPRYAFLSGATTEADVRAVSDKPFEAVIADNYEAVYKILKDGTADVFFDEEPVELLFDEYGDIVTGRFFPIIFSGVSLTTQKPELKPIISIVDKILENGGDIVVGEMYSLGYREYKRHKLSKSLTENERAYIRDNPEVPFLVAHDNYPIGVYNIREKEWQGISIDVVKEIEALTGLTFNVVNDYNTEWSDILGMLERGDGSMVSELIRTPEREGRFLWSSGAYARDNYALISKSEFRDVDCNEILYMTVGVVSGMAYTEMFKTWFPDHKRIVEFGSADFMFDALERGEIDLAMASRNYLLFLTNYRELPGFKVNFLFDAPFESFYGFHIGDTLLVSIVDKALRVINTESIAHRWTNKVYDYRAKLAEERLPLYLGIAALLFCVLTLMIVLYINRGAGKRLEREVSARTAELEEANRAKSNFLATMSHEMRTPMNAIIGMSEVALRRDKMPDMREDVKMIKNASTNLLSIINDVLDFSKIESGMMKIVPENYSVASLVNDVVAIIKVRLDETPVRFYVKTDETVPAVLYGDVARIRQSLLNILGNAVKFTQKGSITLTLHGDIVDDETVMLTIKVTDTGRGIREEDVRKLFGEFVQVDTTMNKSIEGTGLGLAITKHLVVAMGGDVSVKSEYGKGSEFVITLPQKIRSREPMSFADIGRREESTAAAIAFCAPEARVLVVDDVLVNLKVAEGLMAPYKISVDTCLSGAKAIDMVKANRYDMVFMDHMMPEMDGIEATKRIRAIGEEDENYKHLKDMTIIALTANAVPGVKEMFLQNGSNDFLTKPIDTAKLDAILQTWIPKEKQAAARSTVIVDALDAAEEKPAGADIDIGLDALKPILADLKTAIDGINIAAIKTVVKQLVPFENSPDVGGKVADILRGVISGDYDAAVSRIEALLREIAE